jgi:hypothetical protein
MLEDLNRLQGQIETNLDLIHNRRRRDLKKVTKDAMEQFNGMITLDEIGN